MNLGIVVHNLHRSEGTGGYVARLLPYLAKAHRVTVYAARFREELPDGVTAVEVGAVMRRATTALLTFPRAFAAVRRAHDLVHAQGWVTDSAEVVTAHMVMPAWRDALRRSGNPPRLGERLVGPMVGRKEAALLGRTARRVIVPSAGVSEEISRYYGRTSGVRTVRHGFPEIQPSGGRESARANLNLPQDAPIALYVGDLRKGFDVALGAVAKSEACHLAVVSRSTRPRAGPGHGPGPLRTRPKGRWASPDSLGARFHWLGELADLSDAYAAADVLLHPTIYDSFGLVVAEAMAHGVPPVVTRAAGITDLISHEESGWVVDGDSFVGTCEGLATLLSDNRLRGRLGAGAQAVAQERTWEQVARETLAVYDEARAP